MAVTQDNLLKFKPSIRKGKKEDLSNFERGMVVGARRLVWVFQKLLIYWDFHTQPSLEFTENGLKKRKYLVICSCVDENVIVDDPEADGLQQQKTTPGAAPVS